MPILDRFRINDKVALVTGAGRGIGRATALALAENGADIALAARSVDQLELVAKEIRKLGRRALVVQCNAARTENLEIFVAKAMSEFGRIDIVINNAGLAAMCPFEGQTPATWEQLWHTNVMGAVNGCRSALTLMKRQGDGHLINVAALAGITAPPGMAAYVACNAALIRFSEALAAELDGLNIGVSVVCPDLFSSDMSRRMPNADPLSRARLQRAMDDAPESAAEVADTILQQMGKRPLYLFPQPEARRDWRRKRWRPERFVARMAKLGSSLRRYR